MDPSSASSGPITATASVQRLDQSFRSRPKVPPKPIKGVPGPGPGGHGGH